MQAQNFMLDLLGKLKWNLNILDAFKMTFLGAFHEILNVHLSAHISTVFSPKINRHIFFQPRSEFITQCGYCVTFFTAFA